MKVPETEKPRVRRSGFRAVAWILLVAFTLQSFVTATHFHGTSDTSTRAAATASGVAVQRNTPSDNGKAECPFCQAIVHAGAFYAPPAQILVLPLSWATFATLLFAVESFVSASSHLWRSRAPPQH